jgi:hypothetical protein
VERDSSPGAIRECEGGASTVNDTTLKTLAL